jgi:hypothetical protein
VMRLFRSPALASDSGSKVSQMFGRLCSCAGVVCLMLASATSCPAQVSSPVPAAKNPPAREVSHPLSPLHAFLGIDPVTGEFKPPNAVPPKGTPPAQTATKGTVPSEMGVTSDVGADAGSVGQSPLRDILSRAAESGELPPGNTPIGDTTIDALRAEVTQAIDSGDDQALQAVLGKVTGNLGNGGLAFPGAQYVQAATLVFLIYPVGIAMAALWFAWAARRRPLRTDRDRRHDARQLRRRLALALSTAATIGILWWAGERSFWLSEPTKLLAAVGALGVLFLISAGLRLLIRRSASDYARRTIEDLRFQHAALCEEVKELRQRLQGDQIPETV